MAGPLQHPLLLRSGGRVVLDLPVDAVRRLAAAGRMVDLLLRRSAELGWSAGAGDEMVLRRMFPPVDGDATRNAAFGARHGAAVRAEVAGAVRWVLADLAAGGDVEVDRSGLHRWFVGIGALRWLDSDRKGGGARPRARLVGAVHVAVTSALLPGVGGAVALVLGPARTERPRRRPVGFGALTICAVLLAAGLTSSFEPEVPTSAAGAFPAATPFASPQHSPVDDPRLVVTATSCPLPAVGATNEAVERWAQAAVTCLDAVWQPVLAAAGVEYRRPAVMRYRDLARTGCGDARDPTAFYCEAGEIIAVSPSRELAPVPEDDRTGWLLGVMGHEYGHHVQELVGILPALADDEQRRGRDGVGVLASRRRAELQATCYAGLAVAALAAGGSVRAHDVQMARERLTGGGDDAVPGGVRDHGTTAHQSSWLERGLAGRGPVACNSWSAAAAEVE